MMGFRPIAWPIGSVRAGQALAILNMLTPQIQNMGLKTLLCFTMGVLLTACSAKIGHTGKGCGMLKG
jgi:hypothetical protein